MKIRIIFYSDHNVCLKKEIMKEGLLAIGERYYEHCGEYLIQYDFISDITSFTMNKEDILILIVDYLSKEEENILINNPQYDSNNLFLMQSRKQEIKYKSVITLPQFQDGKWDFNICHLLIKNLLNIRDRSLVDFLNKLKNHSLLIGKEDDIGRLLINLLQSLHHMQHLNKLELNIYSLRPLGIEEISDIEDVLKEYIEFKLNFEQNTGLDTKLLYTLTGYY